MPSAPGPAGPARPARGAGERGRPPRGQREEGGDDKGKGKGKGKGKDKGKGKKKPDMNEMIAKKMKGAGVGGPKKKRRMLLQALNVRIEITRFGAKRWTNWEGVGRGG
eukprot:TRINITY_DN2536_c0_g1_i1.p1 TRINITY_DN2536_c0_g1~~TRINITY_DN2536_c0_g1_i1.p1  ORF type:complete len:120 (-),score=25.85 TRINITY_DN2536_c0_g1_i1:183-506(-)